MTAKFEIAAVWILGIVGYLSKHDFLFLVTVTVQIMIGIRNLPGAYKVIKSFKRKK